MALVNGEGPVPSETLILGEAPGADEERAGRPFVGASGKLLDRALDAAGVSRAEVYITNAYKLRPPGNRTPTKAELEEHRGILLQEFREVGPRRILLLGSIALRVVFPSLSVGRARGSWLQRSRWYMPTWHPAYVLRTGGGSAEANSTQEFESDVRRFFNELPKHPEIR